MGRKGIQRKKHNRQDAKVWEASEEPFSLNVSVKELTKLDGNTTSNSINEIETNTRKQVQQDVDLKLRICN